MIKGYALGVLSVVVVSMVFAGCEQDFGVKLDQQSNPAGALASNGSGPGSGPTSGPLSGPLSGPTNQPTNKPTSNPTNSPNPNPSVLPSEVPSSSPSQSPSPSLSPSPSPSPSASPSSLAAGSMLILDPHGDAALHVYGNGSWYADGIITVNSDSSKAVELDGSAELSAAGILINGNYFLNGSEAQIAPDPVTGVSPMADPLAGLAVPDTSGMKSYPGLNISGGSAHLEPGNYLGTISVDSHASVTMDPGVYVLQNGISMKGGSTLNAQGVFIYVAGGSLSIVGDAQGAITPPASGDYAGISVFQARDNTNEASFAGNDKWSMEGTYYFPNAALNFKGNSSWAKLSSFIVYDFIVGGNAGH